MGTTEAIDDYLDGKNNLNTSRFTHILVDEFQDTNSLQFDILCGLAGRKPQRGGGANKIDGGGVADYESNIGNNTENSDIGSGDDGGGHRGVFVVGDEDQAIYGWRGADPRNQSIFDVAFSPEAHTIRRNYRSRQDILDFAFAVMQGSARERERKGGGGGGRDGGEEAVWGVQRGAAASVGSPLRSAREELLAFDECGDDEGDSDDGDDDGERRRKKKNKTTPPAVEVAAMASSHDEAAWVVDEILRRRRGNNRGDHRCSRSARDTRERRGGGLQENTQKWVGDVAAREEEVDSVAVLFRTKVRVVSLSTTTVYTNLSITSAYLSIYLSI